jgi:hypothetical protein
MPTIPKNDGGFPALYEEKKNLVVEKTLSTAFYTAKRNQQPLTCTCIAVVWFISGFNGWKAWHARVILSIPEVPANFRARMSLLLCSEEGEFTIMGNRSRRG